MGFIILKMQKLNCQFALVVLFCLDYTQGSVNYKHQKNEV